MCYVVLLYPVKGFSVSDRVSGVALQDLAFSEVFWDIYEIEE
ncbi:MULTISPECIES: hypothetical protein [unclassified Coleofasciculus]|nr:MULTISPECIES: hypothetical protein [unclassified Coleofasciculus]